MATIAFGFCINTTSTTSKSVFNQATNLKSPSNGGGGGVNQEVNKEMIELTKDVSANIKSFDYSCIYTYLYSYININIYKYRPILMTLVSA